MHPLSVRVGIHLGDVLREGDDILGDAVNIASRIEPLAEPGGVCLSEQVATQVRNKVPYQLEDLGRKSLKGVQDPVGVTRVVMPWTASETSAKGPAVPRLAVLPFSNISPDPRDEYFADGLTEELITILSQLQNLQVIARTSVIQYKSAPKPIPQIGAELGVTAILEGSVRKSDDQLRITVQLIDVGSQAHTWANTYDRKLDDIFSIQTEVAKRIAKALKVKLRKAEESRLDERPKVRPDSYLAYLRGRNLMGSSFEEGVLEEARTQFQLAVSLDPRNAAAYSGLADTTNLIGLFHHPDAREGWMRESRTLAEKALELDPDLAEAHSSLALILYNDLKWAAAEREFEKAIALRPSYSNARMYYAQMLMEEVRPDEALRESALAGESDPQSVTGLAIHTQFLVAVRRMEAAWTCLERLQEIDRAGRGYFPTLAYYHLAKRDLQQARQALDRADQVAPGLAWLQSIFWHVRSGELNRARSLLEQVTARPKRERSYELAEAHALLGDLEGCFRLLDQAASERIAAFQFLRNDPDFEPVRRDPRFNDILRKFDLS